MRLPIFLIELSPYWAGEQRGRKLGIGLPTFLSTATEPQSSDKSRRKGLTPIV
jgi:hypothetical protein